MLLNIAPMADGTIPSGQQSILRAMGDWLGRFGEAVYATRSWTSYGEGPTQMGGGSFSGPMAGTPQDIRFTRSQDNKVLYATALGWQGGTMTITTLNSNQINLSSLTGAQLLGQHRRHLHRPARTDPGRRPACTSPCPRPTRRSAPWRTRSSSPSPARSPPWARRAAPPPG